MDEQKAGIVDVLMLKEAPLLAGIVTLVTQPFAQLRTHYSSTLPDWLPLLIAAIISTLLAFYYIRTVRRTPREESLILIPLVILILFSGSLGANNVVKAAAQGTATSDAAPAVESNKLRERLQSLEAQLELEIAEGRVLRKALGLADKPAAPGAKPTGALSRGPADFLLALFVSDAFAQTEPEPTKPPRPVLNKSADKDKDNAELLRQLKEIEGKKQMLAERRKALAVEDSTLKPNTAPAPLWKSW